MKNNINHIRYLIDLYYTGDTSQSQKKELCQFFLHHPSDELPKDLQEEAELFKTLTAVEAVPPIDLLDEIDKAVREETVSHKTPFLRWLLPITSVAVLCAIFIVSAILFEYNDLRSNSASSIKNTYFTEIMKAINTHGFITQLSNESSNRVTHEPEHYESGVPTETKANISCHRHKRVNSISNVSGMDYKTDQEGILDNYTEINDPEKVAEILLTLTSQISESITRGIETQYEIPELIIFWENQTSRISRYL